MKYHMNKRACQVRVRIQMSFVEFYALLVHRHTAINRVFKMYPQRQSTLLCNIVR